LWEHNFTIQAGLNDSIKVRHVASSHLDDFVVTRDLAELKAFSRHTIFESSGSSGRFDNMKPIILTAITLCILVGAVASSDCPFLAVEQVSKNGRVHVMAKNVTKQPILAYVVVGDRGSQHSVWKGVFSEGSTLKEGHSFDIGEAPGVSTTNSTRIFVDYVRLTDGTNWGLASTQEAKEVIASFQK
jgi:hypothetical protein